MADTPRYTVERRDARRWAVIDTHARSAALRVCNEYATRRQAQQLADAWNAGRGYRVAAIKPERINT